MLNTSGPRSVVPVLSKAFSFGVSFSPGALDWVGLGSTGLDWVDWFGLRWRALDWGGLLWTGVDFFGLGWMALDGGRLLWIGVDCFGSIALDWGGLLWTGVHWFDWGRLLWIGVDCFGLGRLLWTGVDYLDWSDKGSQDRRPLRSTLSTATNSLPTSYMVTTMCSRVVVVLACSYAHICTHVIIC
eukprot:1392317-Amorphochlora_amoeboformis.AAC.3